MRYSLVIVEVIEGGVHYKKGDIYPAVKDNLDTEGFGAQPYGLLDPEFFKDCENKERLIKSLEEGNRVGYWQSCIDCVPMWLMKGCDAEEIREIKTI